MVDTRRSGKGAAVVDPEAESSEPRISQVEMWQELLGIFRGQQQLVNEQLENRQQEGSMTRILKEFKSLRPPVFKGGADPIIADTWLTEITRLLDILNLEEEKRVIMATYQFEGEAVFWWDYVLRCRDSDLGEIKWKEFKETFVEKYFSDSIKDSMEEKFLELKQGLKSVGEYEAEFSRLSRYATQLVTTEERRAKRFIQGLNPIIKERLSILLVGNYGEACQRALALERVLLENAKLWEKRSTGDVEKKQSKKIKRERSMENEDRNEIICHRCRKRRHMRWECPMKNACPRCGKEDHRKKDYPLMKG